MFGWRGRIGLITPAAGNSTEEEFNRFKPAGVSVFTTRIPLTQVSGKGIRDMTAFAEAAARMLADCTDLDLLLFSCTAGSFLEGPGYDRRLIGQLEDCTGVRTTTTSTLLLHALEALGATSVALATPYSREINDAEQRFLEGCGYRVTSVEGPLNSDPRQVVGTPAGTMYRAARKADRPGADVLFISCTGLTVLDIVEPLEHDLGKPVLTSNQVNLWGALRELGIQDDIGGLGQIFTKKRRQPTGGYEEI